VDEHVRDGKEKSRIEVGGDMLHVYGNALEGQHIQRVFGEPDDDHVQNKAEEPYRDQHERKGENFEDGFDEGVQDSKNQGGYQVAGDASGDSEVSIQQN